MSKTKTIRFNAKSVAAKVAKELEALLGPEMRFAAYHNWVYAYPQLNDVFHGDNGDIRAVIRPGCETAGQVMHEVIRQIGDGYKQDGIRSQQAKLCDLLGVHTKEEADNRFASQSHGHSHLEPAE